MAVVALSLSLLCPTLLLAAPQNEMFVVKGKITGDFEKAPQEYQAVLQAVIAALRGETRPKEFGPVLFEGDALINLRGEEKTFLSQFDVESIQLAYIGKEEDGTTQFIGNIFWQDQAKRAAATAFSVTFQVTPNVILVKKLMPHVCHPICPVSLYFSSKRKRLKRS